MQRTSVAMCLLAEVGAMRQRGMYQNSWLDQVVRRFQDRWETSSQYRAAVSGAVGLLLILTLCSCLGVMSFAGNTVLAQFGFSGGNSSAQTNGSTGEKNVSGAATFPIPTFPTFQTPAIPPVSTLPNSQTPPPVGTDTPIPANTATPTATVPCTSNCGGGGGTFTDTQSPIPWVGGHTGTINIHTSSPNAPFSYRMDFSAVGCGTILAQPAGTTDGNGNGSYSFPLPVCSGTGTVVVSASALIGGIIVYGTDYFSYKS